MLNVKKLLTKILSLKPMFEYVGNMSPIHWSSWTATDDGVIIMEIGWLTGGGGGYYYVKDNTANREVAKMTTYSANGTSETRCFPVIKGHTYQVVAQSHVDGNHLNFFFYKIKLGGGYFLKVFSRLAERRWEYAERKETVYECIGSNKQENRNRGLELLCTWYGKINNSKALSSLIPHCSNIQQYKCGEVSMATTHSACKYFINNDKQYMRWLNGTVHLERNIGFVCGKDSNNDRNNSIESISERGWSCA